MKILMCDFTHDTIALALANEVFPLNIGLVASHLIKQCGAKTDVELSKFIEEAEELCDKIGIINKGKLVTLANTKDITNGKKLEQTYLELTKNDK